ncbi:MAG: uracil-DNA glycosylase family protein [Proteobacteria bacterium]|nr:uracil-DNA glycosylase family protein [Pseudomonadota bacterium]
MRQTLPQLLNEVRACSLCAAHLPYGPRPVLQAHAAARLRIVGQAPGKKVHETGIPWNDASGRRLRDWLGLSPEQFYDARKVAIMPMGFCYPGRGASGDLPPRPECAPCWHARLNALLPNVELTILVGRHAQKYYLAQRCEATLGETVKAWKLYLPLGFLPLPHPSPRNQPWCVRNPWFEADLVRRLRDIVRSLAL